MIIDKIIGAIMFMGGKEGKNSTYELLILLVLIILIGYILGNMISYIVDKKLGDIEIQMPNIKVEGQKNDGYGTTPIVFNISKDVEGKININSSGKEMCNTTEKETLGKTRNTPNTQEHFLSVDFDNNDTVVQNPSVTNKQIYKNYTQPFVVDPLDYPIVVNTETPPTEVRAKIGCTTDADCNVVHGNGKNICKSDKTCKCVSGSGLFCHLGFTNYKDPGDMTPEEKRRFKQHFRSNMTLQDYKNWLSLYKEDSENLRPHHRRNLKKLINGGQLFDIDIPKISKKTPMMAADYFQKLYKGGKISVHFPDQDSPVTGYNSNEYNDYGEPGNDKSDRITGVVDLYKDTKDDAKALDWKIRPDVTTGKEEETVGEIYQRYLKKHHNYADIRKITRILETEGKHQIPQRQDTSLKTFTSKDLNVRIPQ